MEKSRRKFLNNAVKVSAGAGLLTILPNDLLAAKKKVSANDKVRIGLIGCKGQGWSNMSAHFKIPEIECVALCDVDKSVLDQRTADAERMQGKKPKQYDDYRKLLDNKDIDAVIIGTPDHWHALQMIHACEAGKDVFVEKPVANTIEECQLMVAAAKRYKKVVQVGQWQRSGYHFENAIKYVQSGKLGQIRLVKTWAYQGWMKSIPVVPDSDPPAGVDYDMWLGPAPKRRFNKNRFHFTFRWFWDYAGGLMTDWGVHLIDIALAGMNASVPRSVMALGGKFAYPDDAAETPDTLQAIYEFDKFSLIWEHAVGIDGGNYGRNHGIAFIGNNGTLVVDRGGWEILPEVNSDDKKNIIYKMEKPPFQPQGGGYLDEHAKDFINCIKTRGTPKCSIEVGAHVATVCQMGNIAFKTGRRVFWDYTKNEFVADSKANELMKSNYQNGWKLPKV